MANLMDVFLNFFNKPKFRSPSEKQISCRMDNNLTTCPIELIQTQFEMPTSSLPSEYMNKKMLEKKLSLKKWGSTLNNFHAACHNCESNNDPASVALSSFLNHLLNPFRRLSSSLT